MSDKPGFVLVLTRIGVLFGLLLLLTSVQWVDVAASTARPQGTSCTGSTCHGQMQFDRNSHHAKSPVTDDDCQVCHAETYGGNHGNSSTVQLRDPDSTGVFHYVTKIRGQRHQLSASDITTLSTFCYGCHDGNGAARLGANAHDPFGQGVSAIPAIGTHSNQDFSGVEEDFYVDCIQCHTSHGSDNLALIDSQVVVAPGVISGTVVFTSQTGPGSRDDSSGNGICVICHTHSSNPGYPMANHSGGLHTGWPGDQRGEDCTTCHPHEPDDNPATRNGHMPAGPNAVGLYGILTQSGLWPVLGLVGVLSFVILEWRKHS